MPAASRCVHRVRTPQLMEEPRVKRLSLVIPVVLFAVSASAQSIVSVDERLTALQYERAARRGGIGSLATNCPAVPITAPATINGQIKASTCRDFLGTAEDVYAITVAAGETLEITMRSSSFEVFLYMWHGNGSITTTREQFHVTSGVSRVTARHTFAQAGTYLIEAGALWTGSTVYPWTGPYTLNVSSSRSNNGGGSCTSTTTTVCLLSGRFRVSIDYLNQFANPPQPGTFTAARLDPAATSPDTATFGFGNAQAVEVVVRIVDARPFAPRYDIYYGGLTDVEYTVNVTDVVTGKTMKYRNPPGTVGGGVDRASFPAQ